MKYNYFPKYANGDYFCSHIPFGPVKILSVKTIEKLKKASFPGEICAQKLSEIGSGDIKLAHESILKSRKGKFIAGKAT